MAVPQLLVTPPAAVIEPKVPLPSNTCVALPVKFVRAISPLVLVLTIAPFAPLAKLVALILPCTCNFCVGVVVPMPSLLLVLSQYRLALELRVLVPDQKATRVAAPLPLITEDPVAKCYALPFQ